MQHVEQAVAALASWPEPHLQVVVRSRAESQM